MGLPYAQESNLYAACFIRGSNKSFCHPPYNLPLLNSMEKNNNSVTDIPTMTNLRLGRRKEYEGGDHRNFCFPVPVGPAKRSRASSQNMLNPCCQVEGCSLDLKSAKDYHRRHRICETHSKSPTVVVAGMERRFCQQCSRFHDLSEFDDKKRSCRRRLSDHNARRRRGVQPESSVQILSSALYDQRQHNYLPLNGLTVPLSNSAWEDANAYMLRQGKSIFELHMDLDKYNHRVLDQCSEIQTAPPYLLNAHSLLSTSSWSLSEGQSTTNSMDGNYNNHHHHHHHHHHYYHQGISHQLFKEVAAYNSDDFCSTQK